MVRHNTPRVWELQQQREGARWQPRSRSDPEPVRTGRASAREMSWGRPSRTVWDPVHQMTEEGESLGKRSEKDSALCVASTRESNFN